MKKALIVIIVIIVILIGGYFLYQSMNTSSVSDQATTTQQAPETNNQNEPSTQVEITIGKTYEVTYTDSGFAPSTLTIKSGDTVTFNNESSSGMWVASGMHPSHIVYSGTSLQEHCPDTANTAFDECQSVQSGESWSFVFNKVGAWGYHNHMRASSFGKIIVE